VIDQVGAQAGCKHPFRKGHSHSVPEALPEGTRRRLHTGSEPMLGVTRRQAAELTKPPDLLDRKIVARQVEERVEEHRPVPAREDKPVSIRPVGTRRIESEDLGEEHHADLRASKRQSDVPRSRLPDGVHRQSTNRPDGQLLCLGIRTNQDPLPSGSHRPHYLPPAETSKGGIRGGRLPSPAPEPLNPPESEADA
jgi:hypothetical protein